jgi:hypothetical protein
MVATALTNEPINSLFVDLKSVRSLLEAASQASDCEQSERCLVTAQGMWLQVGQQLKARSKDADWDEIRIEFEDLGHRLTDLFGSLIARPSCPLPDSRVVYARLYPS